MGAALVEVLSVSRDPADPADGACGCRASAEGAERCLSPERATLLASKRVECLWKERASETVVEEVYLPGSPAAEAAAAAAAAVPGHQQGAATGDEGAVEAGAGAGGTTAGERRGEEQRRLLPEGACVAIRVTVADAGKVKLVGWNVF